jgi:hypothetical protein
LTELIAGRGESGVRSARQTRSQKQTGGSRIKKAALKLETALARIGDVGLRLKMRNDDEKIHPEPGEDGKAIAFLPSQIASDVKIRVDGHSHSPLFADEAREMAVLLKRSQTIDNEMFVRLLNPPSKEQILHGIRQQQKQQRALMQQHPELLQKMMGGHQGRGGRK